MRTVYVLEGQEAAVALRRTLGEVAIVVPYLKAEIGRVHTAIPGMEAMENAAEDGVWLSCRDLVDDPAWLGRVVRASGLVLGTDDPVVAASLFVQGYAYRLLALAVACLTVGGLLPDPELAGTAIGLSRGRPARVAYTEPKVLVVTGGRPVEEELGEPPTADEALRLLLERVVDRHLRPLIASVRRQIRVGERLLWGNVAASMSTAFRTMEGCRGSWVVPLGERMFELAPPSLAGLGSFLTVDVDGRRGWFWERTNCCLFDRLPGGVRCADCSRVPVSDRRSAYARLLTD